MKGIKLGRLELLGWLNEVCETDYPRVEVCCDGIGYCQIIDAIHPGSIPLHKLHFSSKYEDDNARNLKLLDDTCKKLGIPKVVPFAKLAKGKFQDNMEFLQWLYGYSVKIAPHIAKTYNGYEKRLEAYCRQKGIHDVNSHGIRMNAHLVPNKPQIKRGGEDYMPSEEEEKGGSMSGSRGIYSENVPAEEEPLEGEDEKSETNEMNNQRRRQLVNLIASLEGEMADELKNHKIFLEDIAKIETERNLYYGILRQIEEICESTPEETSAKDEILDVLAEEPEDFKCIGPKK